MKTYSENRIELQNLQILKKILVKNQVSFCNQNSPVSRKAWSWKKLRSWKNTLEILRLHWRLLDSSFGVSKNSDIVSGRPDSGDAVGREL